jgi:protein TonB
MGATHHLSMMGQDRISAPGFEIARRRDIPVSLRRRRFFLIAFLASVGVHLGVALLILFLPRVAPREARPQEQGTVELLMVERKGAQPSHAGGPIDDQPAPPRPVNAPKAEPRKEEAAAPASKPAPAQPVDDGNEPAPPESAPPKTAETDKQPPPKQAEAKPTEPRPQEAPVFNLAGTESESNAIVLGGQVLPAMPDDRFRNRPPVYPLEAEMHGQHGSVTVLIHVAENGLAAGVDVVESSGVAVLDQAAVAAVRKWHFRPALKEGHGIPFDMPFRFIFDAN